jgi:hypothetical protein
MPRPKTIRDVNAWTKLREIGSTQLVFARRPSDGYWKMKLTRRGLVGRARDADAFDTKSNRVDLVSAISRALREAPSGPAAPADVRGDPPLG